MSQSHTVPLVGAHFRPPAKAILQVLPTDSPLRLIPEPDNPHDANALAVHVATVDIPESAHEELNALAAPYGFDLAAIAAQESWHLGYVKATEAAWLTHMVVEAMQEHNEAEGGPFFPEFWPAALTFDATGKPALTTEI